MKSLGQSLCCALLLAGALFGCQAEQSAKSRGFFVFAINKQGGDGALFVVQRDGSGLRNLVTGTSARVFDPAISPDGKLVIYSTWDRKQQKLWRVNSDGTDLQCSTNDTFDEASASFLPDGKRVIYHSSLKAGRGCRLWTMAINGSDKRIFSSNRLDVENHGCYSSRGDRVVFAGFDFADSTLGLSVWLHDLVADRRKIIAKCTSDGYWQTPDFSPDGRQILAVLCSKGTASDGSQTWYEVYLLDQDGSQHKRISPARGRAQSACFADRGRSIAYADDAEGAIYVQSLESEQRERVIHLPGKDLDMLAFWEPGEKPKDK